MNDKQLMAMAKRIKKQTDPVADKKLRDQEASFKRCCSQCLMGCGISFYEAKQRGKVKMYYDGTPYCKDQPYDIAYELDPIPQIDCMSDEFDDITGPF